MLQVLRKMQSHEAIPMPEIDPIQSAADDLAAFLEAQVPASLTKQREHMTALRRELAAANESFHGVLAVHRESAYNNRPSRDAINAAGAKVTEIEVRVRAVRVDLLREREAFGTALRAALAPRRKAIGAALASIAADLDRVRDSLAQVDRFADQQGVGEGQGVHNALPRYSRALPHSEELRALARRLGSEV